MPPEHHAVYRIYSKTETIAIFLVCLLFFSLLAWLSWLLLAGALFGHKPLSSLQMGLVISFFSFCVILFAASWLVIFYGHRYRLIIDDGGFTMQGLFSRKTIHPEAVTKLIWRRLENGVYLIKMEAPTQKMAIRFEIFKPEPLKRNALIRYLRETIPWEKQENWKAFCYYVDHFPGRWRSAKNESEAEMIVPNAELGEWLETRESFDRRLLPWMIIGSVIAFPLLLWMGIFLEKQQSDHSTNWFLAIFPSLLVLFAWVLWGLIRFAIPKFGRLRNKNLEREMRGGKKMALGIFAWLLLSFVFVMIWPHWPGIIMYFFGCLPFPILVERRRKQIVKRESNALPDDYFPKTLQ